MFYKLKTILLLFTCIFSFSASADYILGEGRFYVQEDDNLGFVKKQLLFSAYQDILTKEMKNMGLDDELFWQKFDEKFDHYFQPIKTNLREKYKLLQTDGTVITIELAKNKKEKDRVEKFQKSLRSKRLRLRSKFGKLSQPVSSYSIKKMSRSTRYSNSRYLSLNAKVDRKILHNIYLQMISERSGLHFKKLYLSVNFSLQNGTWEDLGVQIESDFTSVVKEYWKRWFQDNYGSLIEEVVLTDSGDDENISNHLKMIRVSNENFSISDATGESKISEYSNCLWLQLKMDIKKGQENALLQYRDFAFDGEYLMIDLNSSNILHSFDFIKQKQRYTIQDLQELSSKIASYVYRIPLTNMKDFSHKLPRIPLNKKQVVLQVSNISNINELFQFNKILTRKGLTLSMIPVIESYTGSTGNILLTYIGRGEDLKSRLLLMNKTRINDNKIVDITSEDGPFNFKLVKSIIESKSEDKNEGALSGKKGIRNKRKI
jgi:hypothetical protein